MSDPISTEPPAWAQQLIADLAALKIEVEKTQGGVQAQADAAQQANIQRMASEARALGYTAGTPEWNLLWDMADTDAAGGDAARAHEMLKAMGKAPVAQESDPQPSAEGQPAAAPPQSPSQMLTDLYNQSLGKPAPANIPQPEAAPAGFPPALQGGVPGTPPADEVDFTDKAARDNAAIAYLQSMSQAQDGAQP